MTFPFFPEGQIRGQAVSQKAAQLYAHMVWLQRWSDEIAKDARIDVKKLAQLAFIHCRLFVNIHSNSSPALIVAFEARCRSEGVLWSSRQEMVDALNALDTDARNLFAFVRDNVPEAREGAKIVYNETNDGGIEQSIEINKPHAVEAEVAKVRAHFG